MAGSGWDSVTGRRYRLLVTAYRLPVAGYRLTGYRVDRLTAYRLPFARC